MANTSLTRLPSLETRRDRSSLLLFHKIHNGAVSVEEDKYLVPAHSSKVTEVSSHSAESCRCQTFSDALKNSFSLNYSTSRAVTSQTTEEFRTLSIW